MNCMQYDIVVVGSGVSGLYATLKIEQKLKNNVKILLITKAKLKDSNSYYAQGGMVAILNENKEDSAVLHINDTLKSGVGLAEEKTVEFISKNSDEVVHDLLNFGVEFDKDAQGNFLLIKEGAHNSKRILHSNGDAIGKQMELALVKAVKENKNIEIKEDTIAVDLLVKNDRCHGLIMYNSETNEYNTIFASNVIVASGGLGQIYKYTTNPAITTGDGYAICNRANAKMRDMEFIQFHPTALAYKDSGIRFLISEALRGEGAKLCDKDGNEFMQKYSDKKELASRDVVARAIFSEMKKTSTNCVYLNAMTINDKNLKKRFPTIADVCSKCSIDITKDYIPVAPAAHYSMGGVKTDEYGQTSIKNLFAIGEVASSGFHGANRLASNSLLECVVMAYFIVSKLNFDKPNMSDFSEITAKYENNPNEIKISHDCRELKKELKETMWENVGIYRNEKGLKDALDKINDIEKKFNRPYFCLNKSEYELRNMLITAKLIVISALNRKESRGAHYRSDYKNLNDNALHYEI